MKAVLRDARIHDINNVAILAERLLEHESKLGNWKIMKDPSLRHEVIFKSIGKAMVNPDYKLLVIDKSGRLTGLFVFRIQYQLEIFEHTKYCDIWLGYSKKSPIMLKTIEKEMIEWAKSKGCNLIKVTISSQNERVLKLATLCGYKDSYHTHEKEV